MLFCIGVLYCIDVGVYMYIVDMCICIGVTNACSSVVLYLYMHSAYDVFFYCFIIHAWPTFHGRLAVGLSTPPFCLICHRAPHSASGLHHSMDNLVITMLIYVLGCTNIILYKYLLVFISLRASANFLGWLPSRLYPLHPLGFIVAIGSALRPNGVSSALWAHRPLGLSASPIRWA